MNEENDFWLLVLAFAVAGLTIWGVLQLPPNFDHYPNRVIPNEQVK